MSEQVPTEFPGFSRPPTPVEGPNLLSCGTYCDGFEGGNEFGPTMCLSLQMNTPVPAPGCVSYGFGVGGPAIAFLPGLVCVVLFVVCLGYLVGFYRARSMSFKRRIPDLSSPGSYCQWRYERNTTVLTFVLIISGLAFFAFGASGSIELKIPFAKVVTSAPGIVVILFGYMFWIRRYSFRRYRNNENRPKRQTGDGDSSA